MDQHASKPSMQGPDRRRFLETSGKAALAAPAVALLLAAGAKPARADDVGPGPGPYAFDTTTQLPG